MTPEAVVFSDPNCPFCYALEERLHALGLDGRVEWRGVAHAPHLPVPMAAASGALAAELGREVVAVGELAPEVEISVPPGKPNTAAAILFAAAALRADAVAGRGFVRSLYRSFWTTAADLSDRAVLTRLARAAGIAGAPPDDEAVAIAASWQRSWQSTGIGGVPLIIRADGEFLYGLVDTDRIRDFFAGTAPR